MSKPEWQSSEYTTLAALSTLSWWRASSCTSVLIPKPMRKAPLKSATCRPPMCILLQNLQMLSHKLSPVRHYTISCVRRRSPGPSEVSRSSSFFFVRARPSAYRRGFAIYINSLRSFFDRLACFSVKSILIFHSVLSLCNSRLWLLLPLCPAWLPQTVCTVFTRIRREISSDLPDLADLL